MKLHWIDIAVILLFLYSAFALWTDRVCNCGEYEHCECRRIFAVILVLTFVYAVGRQAGMIRIGTTPTSPIIISPQDYSLSTSRFRGGLRVGSS